ncbi:ROK family protein [Psychromonas sp. KJ10-2]|uniref:ROK family protein n=1 Tax=Psychromonas sp. KJ10-2 TaxID=3391822 RepID=UPI0039B389BA
MSTIVNLDQVKQLNSATIYKVIEQHAPISRVKISKISHLAPASVTKITRQLMENGLISEVDLQASTGGRRAISLAPNAHNINVIAIRLGQTQLSIAHYKLSGAKQLSKQVTIPLLDNSINLIEFFVSEIAKFITQPALINEKISAISMTISGLVNPNTGTVIYHATYPLQNIALVEEIQKAFNIPTFIGNHTRCLALAEHYFGATQQCQDSILVSVHHGVGSGVIMEGKVLLGKSCNIGEIGHIQINPNGKQCHCGNIGCLETEVSDNAIFDKVKAAISAGSPSSLNTSDFTIEDIYLAAIDKDPLCQSIVQQAATYLGKSIAILVNLLSPEKIVITGKITLAGNLVFDTVKACTETQTLPDFHDHLSVIPTTLATDPTLAAFALTKQAIYEGDLLQRIKV